MKLKLNTESFQTMVAKSVKGSSISSGFKYTSLMEISLKDGELTLTTTDGSNKLFVKSDKVEGKDFYVVVAVDKFSKLISRMTSKEITLEIPDKPKKGELPVLTIHGNGKYVIELEYDEDGELVHLADDIEDYTKWDSTKIQLSTINLMLNTAKAALLTTKEVPCYTGYYVGDKIITTDTYKICGIGIKVFDEPVLITSQMMDLLGLMTTENIDVYYTDSKLAFVTRDVIVYGDVLDGIDDFEINGLNALLDEKFPSSCTIDKSSLLQMLDRVGLFVESFDESQIFLKFTEDGLSVSSMKDSGAEVLAYKHSENFKEFECTLDINLFRTQIKANPSDVVEILYGKENSIKLVAGNVKQVLGLAADSEE